VKLRKYSEALAAFQQAIALAAFQQAIALADDMKEPSIRWWGRCWLGGVYEKLEDHNQALSYYRSSIAVIEEARTRASTAEWKTEFLWNKLRVYGDLLRLLHKMEAVEPDAGHGRQAFDYAERAKARAFLDLLEEAKVGVGITEGIDPDERRRERELRRGRRGGSKRREARDHARSLVS
jgi:tetratricopeptide (TPR) repeat protein